jgi:exopolysaccharide production protein ExoZ
MAKLHPETATPRTAATSLGKIHSIQLMRAVAAMLVVLYHGQLAWTNRFSASEQSLETYIFGFGAVGVHIFFVISGFIMVYTSRFADGFDAKAFFRRRILRIYPIYWISAGLYLSIHWLIGLPYALEPGKVIGALLLLPGDGAAIIGPAWTLVFELFFYLCFGTAMLLGLTRGLLSLSAFFLGAIVLGVVIRWNSPAWELVTSTLLIEFLAGAWVGWLLVRNRLPKGGGPILIALSVAIFVAGMFYGYERLPSVLVWGLPSTLLIAGAIMTEKGRTVVPLVRKTGHFGDSSYALYLIHILLITCAVALTETLPFMTRVDPALMSIPIALVSLFVGEALHHKLERPLLKRLNPRRSLIPEREHPAETTQR